MKKILQGDSLELLSVVATKSIDLIITDPPYDMSNNLKLRFHEEFVRVCRGPIIVFMPPENQWVAPAEQYGFWVKPISTKNTSKSYSRFVEMIFFYQTTGSTWNSDRHWSQYTNVFTDLVDSLKKHPYRKPPSLITRLMLNHSNPGDLVLDPFAGSGVVGEVAELTNRNFILMELDHDLVKAMLQNFRQDFDVDPCTFLRCAVHDDDPSTFLSKES